MNLTVGINIKVSLSLIIVQLPDGSWLLNDEHESRSEKYGINFKLEGL